MTLLLSPSKTTLPCITLSGDKTFLKSDYSVTTKEHAHLELLKKGEGITLTQIGGKSYVYFGKDEDAFELSKGDELCLPLGGSISTSPDRDCYFTLEKLVDPNPQKPADDKEKIEAIMEMIPEVSEKNVAIALCESKGDFDATIEYLMESKKRKNIETPNDEEEEGRDYALALQMQEDMNRGSFSLSHDFGMPTDDGLIDSNLIVVPLECGVVLFKNCLLPDQQIGIYEQCCELSRTQNPAGYANVRAVSDVSTQMHPSALVTLNWGGHKKAELPADLVQFAKNTFQKAYANYKKNEHFNSDLPSNLRCPTSFNADALHSIMYPINGKLHSHLDGALGWVLSVSIGNSCISIHFDLIFKIRH